MGTANDDRDKTDVNEQTFLEPIVSPVLRIYKKSATVSDEN